MQVAILISGYMPTGVIDMHVIHKSNKSVISCICRIVRTYSHLFLSVSKIANSRGVSE